MRPLKITQSITQRDAQSLDRYLLEISRLSSVTMEEEAGLARRIRNGDQEALDQLTRANLRFVVSVAKQFQYQGMSLSDLISEGNIGLMKAAQRFDETKGFKFISYAVWWIRQSILHAIMSQGRMVHLPANRTALSLRIQKASAALEQDLERMPSENELAVFLGVSAQEVEITRPLYPTHTSLDAPKGDQAEGTLLDDLEQSGPRTDASTDHHHSLQVELERVLNTLSLVEKKVICLFFGIGVPVSESLKEIAGDLDLSSERVRQIKDKALTKLRQPNKISLLRSYLGA
ncbi:MAG TPA: RNA polymerase sigma factor RpoD/SigA [Chitinophagaceae bacterium]|jgi:RNA polymerase primary sigma factor|nr:RNA polymerase sigma factor RpoD/SigA [Chitinophagaceae bacterium]